MSQELVLKLMQTGQSDWLSWILFLVVITVMQFYASKLQAQLWINEIRKALSKLEEYMNDATTKFVKEASKYGRSEEEVKSLFQRIKGFFIIEPVTLDPFGAVKRLEHLIENSRNHLNSFMKEIAPNADEWKRSNLRDQLAGVLALDMIYRIVRHYFILGRKTQNLIYIAQIQMLLPEILRAAKAYWKAGEAFRKGIPIGDSIGPMVALKLMNNANPEEVAEEIVGAEVELKGRRVYVIKAKGPGSEVGRPGVAIERIVEGRNGDVSLIVMIDAAAKLEGEPTAEVVEGIGAAIGDPGPEKYRIEEVATKYNIPLYAIAIKEDPLDAITVMREEIAKSVDEVLKRIELAIESKTLPGDFVLVAGIGNTAGVGNILERDSAKSAEPLTDTVVDGWRSKVMEAAREGLIDNKLRDALLSTHVDEEAKNILDLIIEIREKTDISGGTKEKLLEELRERLREYSHKISKGVSNA